MFTPEYDFMLKFIIHGEIGVGKSCLLLRFADGTYSEGYISTIGVDFKTKIIPTPGDKKAKLQIWDTPGPRESESLPSPTSNYANNPHGAILAYDITDRETFDNLPRWIQDIKRVHGKNCQLILAGTKNDLSKKRVVSPEEAEEYAKSVEVSYIEVSAKDHVNVDLLFHTLAEQILEKRPNAANVANAANPNIESKKTVDSSRLVAFLSEISTLKTALRQELESTFCLSEASKRIQFQALDALEKTLQTRTQQLRSESATLQRSDEAYLKIVQDNVTKIREDARFIGVEKGFNNPVRDLFEKFLSPTYDKPPAEKSSCCVM